MNHYKSNDDDYCSAVTWTPGRGNYCWKQYNRCFNANPVSKVLWTRPYMAGAVSAYKHYKREEIFTINSQTDQFDFDSESANGELISNRQLSYYSFRSEIQTNWQLLNNQVCPGNDLHRIEFMRHASSINECIAQCYGF